MLVLKDDHQNAKSINCQPGLPGESKINLVQLKLFSDSEPVLVIPENRIPLLSNLHYHGFNYTLVCRGRRSCVYHQMYEGKTVGYEISLIRIQKEVVLYGKTCLIHERWPKDGDFGNTAWTCWTLDEAITKYNILERPFISSETNQLKGIE